MTLKRLGKVFFMQFNLKKILKALLFSTSEWLSIKDIQAVISRYHEENERAQADEDSGDGLEPASADSAQPGVEGQQALMKDLMAQVPTLLTATQIREAMDEIAGELQETCEVYKLLQGPNGFRLSISPDYADWVRLLRNDPRPQRLKQAALETLAIIAYRQPVTRAEIEAIRGVNADSAIARLTDRDLIYVVGRADLPGRPLQYATTPHFLEFIGITSIEELPASDVLSPNQISEWIRRASNPAAVKNEDVGLPGEDKKSATLISEPSEKAARSAGIEAENSDSSEGDGGYAGSDSASADSGEVFDNFSGEPKGSPDTDKQDE